jgi:hypothetical protein
MSLNRKLKKLIENRPQYEISDEYYKNQALAQNAAFGRDSAIQQQEQNINQSAADSIGQAQEVSSSTGSILSTLAAINNNKNSALQDLGVQEGQVSRANRQDYMGSNAALAEEQDKQWNYNVNEPYQNQIQSLRDRKKARQEAAFKVLDTVGSVASAKFLGGK